MIEIKEIMTRTPEFINPDTPVTEAAFLMDQLEVGFLPIGDPQSNKLIGTITDRDIVINAIAKNKNLDNTTVREVMSSNNIYYCFENDTIEKAISSMKNKKVRRLIIVNDDKNLTGVVSFGDLAKAINDSALIHEALEAIST